MGPGTLALAFALSLGPVVLAALEPGSHAGRAVSHLALALLPWIALAGLPRARAGASAAVVVAAALPALALAAASDASVGLGAERIAVTSGSGLLLIALLSHAAARGRGALYGILWCCLVPGLAALSLAWDLVAGVRSAASVDALGGASPIVWSLAAARGAASPHLALGSGLVLLFVALLAARPSGESEAAP